MKVCVHALLETEDYEIFRDICKENNTSVSATISTLVNQFLDSKDVSETIKNAQKIKVGRPKGVD